MQNREDFLQSNAHKIFDMYKIEKEHKDTVITVVYTSKEPPIDTVASFYNCCYKWVLPNVL